MVMAKRHWGYRIPAAVAKVRKRGDEHDLLSIAADAVGVLWEMHTAIRMFGPKFDTCEPGCVACGACHDFTEHVEGTK